MVGTKKEQKTTEYHISRSVYIKNIKNPLPSWTRGAPEDVPGLHPGTQVLCWPSGLTLLGYVPHCPSAMYGLSPLGRGGKK